MNLKIKPSIVSGMVSAPSSKSYTHRALILGSLAQGETVIENFLASDDIQHTINACRSLGVNIQSESKNQAVDSKRHGFGTIIEELYPPCVDIRFTGPG